MSWITKIVVKKELEKLNERLSNIAKKDDTFKFRIVGKILEVESESKDKAYKRGVWLVKNIKELENCGFEVEEGEEKGEV